VPTFYVLYCVDRERDADNVWL